MAFVPAYSFSSLPLLLLGLWHFISCSRAYLKSPTNFSARTWHPCSPPLLRYLELYLELTALLVATIYQSISLSHLPFHSLSQILALQEAALLGFFLLLVILTLISETTGCLPLPPAALFLMLGLAFSLQYMVFGHSSDPSLVLEKECFDLQRVLAAACIASCLLLAWRPRAFLVNVVLSGALALQGTWLLQVGLSLFAEFAIPEGCHHLSTGATQCDVEAAKVRAIAIMDLIFMAHIISVVCLFSIIYGFLSRGATYKKNGGYDALDTNGESDHVQMKPLTTKVVID